MLVAIATAGCAPGDDVSEAAQARPASSVVGRLQNAAINEASGLARSQRFDNVFWVVNDDGPAVLYAIDGTGRDLGQVSIRDVNNRDWEDLASFTLDGVPYLAVAAIGDNEARRKDVHVDIVEEPQPGARTVDAAWRIEFRYPDGPRDAEALAVDPVGGEVLVLTKRDVPARLYSVPLFADDDTVTAEPLGYIASLPQPRPADIERAPRYDDWFWQPTAMDLSPDRQRLAVLTYGGVFLYERQGNARWPLALGKPPKVLTRSGNPKAESITFDATGESVLITIEQAGAPLYRLELDREAPE